MTVPQQKEELAVLSLARATSLHSPGCHFHGTGLAVVLGTLPGLLSRSSQGIPASNSALLGSWPCP